MSRLVAPSLRCMPPFNTQWLVRSVCSLLATAVLASPSLAQGPPSVAEIAEKLFPAVVNISTTQMRRGPEGIPLPKVPKGSPFEEFFDDFFDKRGNGPSLENRISSLGSGFIIDGSEGFVVTNNHVIDGADEIFVVLQDGSRLKVEKIIGRDSKTDLALLKVKPRTPLTAVEFGPSEDLKVGDWVMAIGNPFGLGGSLTLGIISAKQRDINAGPYDEFLQTDAAINKGNSGGPLFDMHGKVVGVNTAIISPTGGSIGIGFATPSDVVNDIIGQLRQYGAPQRGWLGVKIQTITDDIASSLGVPENSGALVAGVTPSSPADKAGLRSGDIVLQFGGKKISTMRNLPRLVAQAEIGKESAVEILRRGEKLTVNVVIGRLDEGEDLTAPAVGKTEDKNQPGTASPVLGLSLAPLTEDLRGKMGLDQAVSGVVVLNVDPSSPAGEKDIRAGDVIAEVQQEPVTTLEDVVNAVDKAKRVGSKTVLILVENVKGDTRFVAVPVE